MPSKLALPLSVVCFSMPVLFLVALLHEEVNLALELREVAEDDERAGEAHVVEGGGAEERLPGLADGALDAALGGYGGALGDRRLSLSDRMFSIT